jgi:TolA-binding protein
VKTKELGPFEYVIKKEFFIVQDSRPLYHFAEMEAPLSSLQLEAKRLKELKIQEEKDSLFRLQQQEEEEVGEQESLEEGEEEGSLEGSQQINILDDQGLDENKSQATEKQPSIDNEDNG